MIVVGAGGLATQLIEDLIQMELKDIVFWSETESKYSFIKELYPVINSDEEVINHFKNVSNAFILCIGTDNSNGRKKLSERFKKLGGTITSFLSPYSRISPYGTEFGQGTIVLNQVNIEPGVIIGEECLINKTAQIGHGCIIGSYCEVSPDAMLTGEVVLGTDTFIGARALILPKLKIGKNVTIGAGSIVTKNIPDNVVVAGLRAEIKYTKKNVS